MLPVDDQIYTAQGSPDKLIPPSFVEVPGGLYVPQYAPTVIDTSVAYDPPGNCDGNFMSYRFQPNNNCYNYSCNIATNSFAQPGRKHGFFLNFPPTGPRVVEGAQRDGLLHIGGADMLFSSVTPPASAGHLVALLISKPEKPDQTGWNGDYHWVRCDDHNTLQSWSQKDGGDQVTHFDFAGIPITNPTEANWSVNQGPTPQTRDYPDEVVAVYEFYAWMWVPREGADII
jgi:hypothetical protein